MGLACMEFTMLEKVRVTSGMCEGLVGRIIYIDSKWPAPYGILHPKYHKPSKYDGRRLWFHADELVAARADENETKTWSAVLENKGTRPVIDPETD